MLFASDLAIGQSSTEPIQQLPEVNLWRPLLGVPLTQTAWAAALVGVGTCYESPVTETPGLQGCLEDHATGTVQDTGPACSATTVRPRATGAWFGKGGTNKLEHRRA